MLVNILVALTMGCFAAIVFISFYFRYKVVKAYYRLLDQRVEFQLVHIFNQKRLEDEILPKYPNAREHILAFTHGIRFSMQCASILIVVVSVFAGILMFMRE